MKSRFPSLVLVLLATHLLAACGGGGGAGGGEGGQPLPPLKIVTNLDDSGPGSLRQTVADAADDEWVVFDSSLATGTINLLTPLTINKPVVIGGLSGTFQRFRISGQNNVRIFEMQSGSSLDLRDLELFDGDADFGGAIRGAQVSVTATRVQFVSNYATFGGAAIQLFESQLTVTGCAFTAGLANWGGAISVQATDVTIDRCGFFLNTADTTGGGALHVAGGSNVSILNSTFDSNETTNPVDGRGGAIVLISGVGAGDDTHCMIRSTTISNNSAAATGGGIDLVHQGASCTLDMSQTILATNTATTHADIYFSAGSTGTGSNNLIGVGDDAGMYWNGISNNIVGDAFTPEDPLLLAASFTPAGQVIRTPHMVSPARDHVPAGQSVDLEGAPLMVDERGMPRNPAAATDIGAVEE